MDGGRTAEIRGAAALTGITFRLIATSSALLGQLLHASDKAARSTDWDSGSPAIVELSLGRPETLRPHLSVGLPLSEIAGGTIH